MARRNIRTSDLASEGDESVNGRKRWTISGADGTPNRKTFTRDGQDGPLRRMFTTNSQPMVLCRAVTWGQTVVRSAWRPKRHDEDAGSRRSR